MGSRRPGIIKVRPPFPASPAGTGPGSTGTLQVSGVTRRLTPGKGKAQGPPHLLPPQRRKRRREERHDAGKHEGGLDSDPAPADAEDPALSCAGSSPGPGRSLPGCPPCFPQPPGRHQVSVALLQSVHLTPRESPGQPVACEPACQAVVSTTQVPPLQAAEGHRAIGRSCLAGNLSARRNVLTAFPSRSPAAIASTSGALGSLESWQL